MRYDHALCIQVHHVCIPVCIIHAQQTYVNHHHLTVHYTPPILVSGVYPEVPLFYLVTLGLHSVTQTPAG